MSILDEARDAFVELENVVADVDEILERAGAVDLEELWRLTVMVSSKANAFRDRVTAALKG